MRLLVDECVPVDVTTVFAGRGHQILFVIDELAPKTPDAIIAQFASIHSLICVTWNRRHFRNLLSRRPRNNQIIYPHAGLIAFACPESRGAHRAQQVCELIEFEHQLAQTRHDKRLIVDITVDYLQIWW